MKYFGIQARVTYVEYALEEKIGNLAIELCGHTNITFIDTTV